MTGNLRGLRTYFEHFSVGLLFMQGYSFFTIFNFHALMFSKNLVKVQIKNAISKAILYHPKPFLSMKTIKGEIPYPCMQAIAEMKKMQKETT